MTWERGKSCILLYIAEAIHLQAAGRYTELIIAAGQQTDVRLLTRNVCSRLLLSGQNGRTQTVWE